MFSCELLRLRLRSVAAGCAWLEWAMLRSARACASWLDMLRAEGGGEEYGGYAAEHGWVARVEAEAEAGGMRATALDKLRARRGLALQRHWQRHRQTGIAGGQRGLGGGQGGQGGGGGKT